MNMRFEGYRRRVVEGLGRAQRAGTDVLPLPSWMWGESFLSWIACPGYAEFAVIAGGTSRTTKKQSQPQS